METINGDWFMKGWRVAVNGPDDRFFWVSRQQLADTYPLPTAFLKLLG